MYLKDHFLYKLLLISVVGSYVIGCSAKISDSLNNYDTSDTYISRYLVPNQLPAPQTIKSIQLYRKGSITNPPIIELESPEKLILAFDELSDLTGQFRVTFTHHDQEWNESNIPQDWYLEGRNELILGSGNKNELSQPDYIHYNLEFPSGQLQFKTSGNFMLHVSDLSSGIRLFSLPFFVTENAGTMVSEVETNYNAGQRFNAVDRPFSLYKYPDFVEFPQFDLSFYFVQNRFWGDTRRSENYDFSEEGKAQYHLSSENAFAANYDFIRLDLTNFSIYGRDIIDWFPGKNPPEIILKEDVLNFSSDPLEIRGTTFGNPKTSEQARYASVRFRFQDGGQYTEDPGVYLVGDFNQWILSDQNKLNYNEESGYWETTSLIKQGTYTYKYAVKDSTAGIDDLILSDTITRQDQEYISFVYFDDPDYSYQRLLYVQVFNSR